MKLLLLGFFCSWATLSQGGCPSELLAPNSPNPPNGTRKPIVLSSHEFHYDKLLPSLPIKKQAMGTCGFSATLTLLEYSAFRRTGKPVSFSLAWLELLRMTYRAAGYAVSPNRPKTLTFNGGGFSEVLSYLVFPLPGHSYLMPEEVWTPPSEFWQAAALYNRLVTGVSAPASSILDEIVRLVETAAKSVPKTFQFAGQEHSPTSFASLLPTLQFASYDTSTDPRWDKLLSPGLLGPITIHYRSLANLENPSRAITQAIDQDDAVYVEMQWHETFLDEGRSYLSLPHLAAYPEEGSKHAVIIVGYHIGTEGVVDRWLVQNSWGYGRGDGGYYHLDDNYLKHYMRALVLPTK